MDKQHTILLLRLSFWIGAIIDALAATQFLLPTFWASFDGLTTYTANNTLNFALGIASALMFGWTALLIWADRKPIERKGILLLTVFPVVFGLAFNNVLSVTSRLRTLESAAPELVLQAAIATLLIFSYLNARKEIP
jgi:hypothetical protein